MNKLILTSPIPPSVNHYMAYRVVNNGGRMMAASYCTKEAKEYKKNFAEYVRAQVEIQNWNLTPNKEQHFYVTVTPYFPRIDMDANNYWKCMLDAITETQLIWLDDNVVCERVDRILYDNKNPHFEITIEPVDYIGIFKNKDDYNFFNKICGICNRGKRNCSIKNNAIAGKIQEEVQDRLCTKFTELKEKK